MTPNIAILALVFSCVAYGAISYAAGRDVHSLSDYFHTSRPSGGVLTLVVSNLTLGTGLVYSATLASEQGLWALAAPAGVLLGYMLLAAFVAAVGGGEQGNRTLVDFIRSPVVGNRRPVLYAGYILVVLVTYVFLISFEIFASAGLIAHLVDSDPTPDLVASMAVALLGLVVGYTIVGGIRGVISTDALQGAFMFLATAILCAVALAPSVVGLEGQVEKSLGDMQWGGRLERGAASVVVPFAAFVTAVATQFYSILNVSVGSNFSAEVQASMYRKVGIGVAAWLTTFLFIGFSLPAPEAGEGVALLTLVGHLGSSSYPFSAIIVFLLVLGMVGILFSTVDTGLMAITQITHDEVLRRDSYANQPSDAGVARAKRLTLIVSVVLFVPTLAILRFRPALVPLLLATVYALTALAPLLVTAAYCQRRFGRSVMLRDVPGAAAIVLVLGLWAIAIRDVLVTGGANTPLVVCAAVGLGILGWVCEWTFRRVAARS